MRRHLPNPTTTPGECKETASFRHLTLRTKMAVYRAYGIPLWQRRHYMINRLIPLDLLGTNGPKNLWPQPKDEAHLKEVDENRLIGLVAANRFTLAQAQQQIRALWSQDQSR